MPSQVMQDLIDGFRAQQKARAGEAPPPLEQWKESQPKPALDPDDVLAIMAEAQLG